MTVDPSGSPPPGICDGKSHSEALGFCFLVLAALVSAGLPRWIALDEAALRWIQFHRTCAIDAAARWIDPVVRLALGVLLLAILRAGGWRRSGLLRMAVWIAAGAGFAELLKTAIERLRPDSMPFMTSGNSFPSGHIMNTAMFAAAAWRLDRERPSASWQRVLVISVAAASVLAQSAFRLIAGAHWPSDVAFSIFLGIGWMIWQPAVLRLPKGVFAVGLVLGVAAFALFEDVPAIRLHLPSALDDGRPPVVSVDFGVKTEAVSFEGAWRDGPAEPIGEASWALEPEVRVRFVQNVVGGPAVLKVAMRPPTGTENRRECRRVSVSVNGWRAPEVSLTRGWREYHFPLPDGALRRGPNTVAFTLGGEAPPSTDAVDAGLVAFRYLHVVAGGPVS